MLIKSAPDRYDKLQILGGMAAADDILTAGKADGHQTAGRQNYGQQSAGHTLGAKFAAGSVGRGPNRIAYSDPGKNPAPGIYKASLPNGKKINLMRVMFTDFCKMDCAYCPNSIYVPRKRYAFKRDELADTFMELHQRLAVDGLFLSSGIAGDGSKTTQRLVETVEIIRKKHGFRGYIHMKVMPGASRELVERAHRLGSRLSVNIETPEADMMRRISPHKDLRKDILDPMAWISELTAASSGGAVGQATQFVVGAADESDRQIYRRVDQMYADWNLKRVYYPPFRPARHTPMEEKPPVPAAREHRLYQMDWLRRVYQFDGAEIDLAFDGAGFLSLEQDPKSVIAMENLDAFPIDLNAATREQLLRIPGVGPVSAGRIVDNRRRHRIDNWRDLQAMGVVRKRAWPYVVFPGQRPPSGKQLRLDLFDEARERRAAESASGGGAVLPEQPSPGLAAIMERPAGYGVGGAGASSHACRPGSMGAMCNVCPANAPNFSG